MPRHCLIVESIPLIAHDLSVTAQAYGMTPVVVADEAEALSWVGDNKGAEIGLAFVHQSASMFSESLLKQALLDLQVRVVLMGNEAMDTQEAREWAVLDWPFTTTHVTALLDSLGGRPLGTCGS